MIITHARLLDLTNIMRAEKQISEAEENSLTHLYTSTYGTYISESTVKAFAKPVPYISKKKRKKYYTKLTSCPPQIPVLSSELQEHSLSKVT